MKKYFSSWLTIFKEKIKDIDTNLVWLTYEKHALDEAVTTASLHNKDMYMNTYALVNAHLDTLPKHIQVTYALL